jgi:hypothetical protein
MGAGVPCRYDPMGAGNSPEGLPGCSRVGCCGHTQDGHTEAWARPCLALARKVSQTQSCDTALIKTPLSRELSRWHAVP